MRPNRRRLPEQHANMNPPPRFLVLATGERRKTMSKQSLLLALGSGLALAGLWARLELEYQPPAYRYLLDPAELARQAKTIDDRTRARKRMLELRDGILERLAQGTVSLPQPCNNVYQNAWE